MTDINAAAQAMTGTWVQLKTKADGAIEGQVLSFEVRPATFEGAPRLSRKTGAQRFEWVFAVQTDGGDVVKFSLSESGQRAVADAIKESGQPAKNGDRIKIAVKEDKETERDQPTYQVRWTPDSTPLDIPVASDESEPF